MTKKTTKAEIKPTVDFPLSDAFAELTGREWREIKAAMGVSNLGDVPDSWDLMRCYVWQFEKRARPDAALDEIDGWSNKRVRGYFAEETDEEAEGKEPPDESATGS